MFVSFSFSLHVVSLSFRFGWLKHLARLDYHGYHVCQAHPEAEWGHCRLFYQSIVRSMYRWNPDRTIARSIKLTLDRSINMDGSMDRTTDRWYERLIVHLIDGPINRPETVFFWFPQVVSSSSSSSSSFSRLYGPTVDRFRWAQPWFRWLISLIDVDFADRFRWSISLSSAKVRKASTKFLIPRSLFSVCWGFAMSFLKKVFSKKHVFLNVFF